MAFPFYKQQDRKDCGPTCLRIICKFYGRNIPIQKLRNMSNMQKGGVSLLDISEAAEQLGFRTMAARMTYTQLTTARLPCILHWHQNHFVIVHKVDKGKVYIANPRSGLVKYDAKDFVRQWYSHSEAQTGVALMLETTPTFHEVTDEKVTRYNWLHILKYFYTYRGLVWRLLLSLLVGTVLSLITPFFTQAIVDIGVGTKDLSAVTLILIAQLLLFAGSISVNFIRSWIMLHVSTRVNIAIQTDFLIKLMKLPMGFFATKTQGDIIQRMSDQQSIERFITGTTLNTIFSVLNLVIFTFVLYHYSPLIFLISLGSTALYTLWIIVFLKKRRELNYKQFDNNAMNQTTLIELVKGMQDIKLSNAEKAKRWEWEHVQARLFEFNIRGLALNQYQQFGTASINQVKNILITFFSVSAVIKGDLTLGGMMAIQYIVGQVSAPIDQLLGFVQSYQDAKISLERLNEIHDLEDEENMEREWVRTLSGDGNISFNDIKFRYPGAGNELIFEGLNLTIPANKVTAIVGMSGSGKTTLMKLLMRFYELEKGTIKVGSINLMHIGMKFWRSVTGIVSQDGYIFSDTISGNIAVGEEIPDPYRLQQAIDVANLREFIDEQPFGLLTKIGPTGNGISEGQKQRIFIARAVYKNPQFLFFDEATNCLDANNERVIMENLSEFNKNRTVVVIAHRLSTVVNADQIVVINKGRIVEQGRHEELINSRGAYYELIRNQLELGQ